MQIRVEEDEKGGLEEGRCLESEETCRQSQEFVVARELKLKRKINHSTLIAYLIRTSAKQLARLR